MSASRDRAFALRSSSTGSRDQRRIDDGAATQQRTAGLQKLRNSGEYRLRQLVALQEMPEVQDGRFVGNCVVSELQTCERAHRADVVKHFFRAGIGEVVPLLTGNKSAASRPTEKAAARHSD